MGGKRGSRDAGMAVSASWLERTVPVEEPSARRAAQPEWRSGLRGRGWHAELAGAFTHRGLRLLWIDTGEDHQVARHRAQRDHRRDRLGLGGHTAASDGGSARSRNGTPSSSATRGATRSPPRRARPRSSREVGRERGARSAAGGWTWGDLHRVSGTPTPKPASRARLSSILRLGGRRGRPLSCGQPR